MCNAKNHDPDCDCGFGPPYSFTGNANIVRTTKWGELAAWDESAFMRGINEVIMDDGIKQRIIDNYKQKGFPLERVGAQRWKSFQPDKKREVKLALQALLKVVHIKKEKSTNSTIRIPLFKLYSPPVTGSKVTYHEGQKYTPNTWNITIGFPGVGMASWKTLKVSYSCDVVCKDGCSKIIFMPLDIKITPLKVYDDERKLLNTSLQVEAASKNNNKNMQRVIRSCNEDTNKDKASTLIDKIDLSEDYSDTPTERRIRLEHNRKRNIDLSVSAFGMKAALSASVEFENVLEIKSLLPPRHNYYMFNIRGIHGVLWRVREPIAV